MLTVATSPAEGEAYLLATSFDIVVVDPSGDHAWADRVCSERGVPVETAASGEDLVACLASRDDAQAVLLHVRSELARIAHDLNNPLAIIAGNVQLAREVARVEPPDEAIDEGLSNISEAARALETLIGQIGDLRSAVDRALRV